MLSDQDIAKEQFRKGGATKLVDPLPEYDGTRWADLSPDDPKWDSIESPIQPSSIDMHVGYIYVPGKKTGELGSETRPASSHTVGPGESVIVSTFERLTLPTSIGAIVFPPSRLSSQGVLVANIGHIDPGFSGPLRFTIINMGAKPIPLSRGTDAVGTLLLLRLSSPSHTPWPTRKGGNVKGEPTRDELDALSRDFANTDARIEKVTRRTVDKMKESYNLWAFVWPLLLSIVLGVVAIYWSTGEFLSSRIEDNVASIGDVRSELADSKIEFVQQQAAASAELAKLRFELEDARNRVAQLEDKKNKLGQGRP